MNEKSYQDKQASMVNNHKTQYAIFLSQCLSRQLVNVLVLGGSREQKPNIEKAEAPTKWRMLQMSRMWKSRVAFKSTVKEG